MLGTSMTDSDLLLSTADSKPQRANTVSRAWTILAPRSGLRPMRPDDARHTRVSSMLKQGVHPKIVQERLRRASMHMPLDTYSHVVTATQQGAAESFDNLVSPKYNGSVGENELIRSFC